MQKVIEKEINGWKALFLPKESAQTINIRAIVNAGSAHETHPEIFGAAHFLEHMFFKGTERFSYTDINRKFAELGDVNAYTSLERTVFYLNSLPNKFESAADIFLDLFFNARMPEDELEKERNVILEELQSSEDNPISWGLKRINWDTWGDTMHPTIGTRESVSSIQLNDLKSFREHNYTPERTVFVVTGNLEESRVWQTLEKLIPNNTTQSHANAEPKLGFQPEHYKLDNPNSKQSLLFLIFPTVTEKESRQMHFIPELAVNLIGGGMHSILFEKLREEMGLCYAVGMNYMTPCREGYHSIYCMLDAPNVQKATSAALEELHKLTEKLPDGLMNIAKSNMLFSRSRAAETASGTAVMADGYFDHGRELISFEEFKSGIESIKEDEIRAFIKQYLKQPKIAVVNAEIPELVS